MNSDDLFSLRDAEVLPAAEWVLEPCDIEKILTSVVEQAQTPNMALCLVNIDVDIGDALACIDLVLFACTV